MKFYNTRHLTSRAWISGLVGLVTLHAIGMATGLLGYDKIGWHIFRWKIADPGIGTDFLALPLVALAMLLTELRTRWQLEGRSLFVKHPLLERGDHRAFAHEVIYHAIGIWFWLGLAWSVYHLGYHGTRFAMWKFFYDHILLVLAILTVPYLALTRGWQYDEDLDRGEASTLFWRLLFWMLRRPSATLDRQDGQAFLGLCVKFFFVPLMSIFFIDHIGHLRKNWRYLLGADSPFVKAYPLEHITKDIYNITFTFIMVTDVALAWCGYVLTSRWIRNGMKSVEPTILGWLAALMCYPPFNNAWSKIVHVPGESMFLRMQSPGLVLALALLALTTYAIYTSATVMFGLRFSNLTNRGIIRTGPYRWVRHPAYAAKNISWWLVMCPFVFYDAFSRSHWQSLYWLVGLAFMTGLYYVRAITEERHLSADPDYQEYCREVKYRFIPGLL